MAGGGRVDKRPPSSAQSAGIVRQPPNQQQEIARQQVVGISWSGPLPDPAILAAYERLLPGSAQRIFDRSDMQSDHRMKLELTVVEGAERRANRGQWMALAIALVGLAVTGGAFYTGHEVGGSIVGGGVLVNLAGIFIYGRYDQRKEREQKAKILQSP